MIKLFKTRANNSKIGITLMNDCSRPSVVTRAAFWGPTHYKTWVLETCTESVLFDVIVESKIIKHCHIQIAMSQFLFMIWDIHPPPPLFCLQRKPTQKLSATTCQKIRPTCQSNNIQQSFDESIYELLHTQLDNYWKFDNLFKSFEFRKWWMAKVFSRITCNQTRTFKIMLTCHLFIC